MSAMPAWVPLLAAFIGAIVGGGLKAIIDLVDRNREDEAILIALASEIRAICALLRAQDYVGHITAFLKMLDDNPGHTTPIVIDLRSDYFSVFHALADKLGRLDPAAVAAVVRFYLNCKTIVDSSRPDGVAALPRPNEELKRNLRGLLELLNHTLRLGDQVVQMPKQPLGILPGQTP